MEPTQQPLTPVQETYNSTVNATLAISNTDIVTMVMNKNKKILKEKLKGLEEKLDAIISRQTDELKELVDEAEEGNNLPAIKAAYLAFIQTLVGEGELLVRIHHLSWPVINETVRSCYIYPKGKGHTGDKVGFSTYAVNLEVFSNDESVLEKLDKVSHRQEVPFKMSLNVDRDGEADLLKDEIKRLTTILQNERVFQEEIVANITEQAILNSPALLNITGNIKMIE